MRAICARLSVPIESTASSYGTKSPQESQTNRIVGVSHLYFKPARRLFCIYNVKVRSGQKKIAVLQKYFSALLLLLVGCTQAYSPTAMRSAPVAPASPPQPVVDYIPIVQLQGDPQSIGQQYGEKLGPTMRLLLNKYLLVTLSGSELLQARLAAVGFEMQMLPEHREEIAALAQSAGVNPIDVALAQCFLDLTSVEACSTITLGPEAAPDHIARFGRNLDFPSLNVIDKYTTVLIYHPTGKYQFASIGWPGMIGVLSGMNEWGLTISNMEVDRTARPPVAMPYTLLYRAVLENCRTVDEAIAFLQNTPRQSANNLMLMDAAGNRAVAEITPDGVTVRRGSLGSALISTNHQRGQDTDTPGYCWRYDSLHADAAAHFGSIDQSELHAMLSKVIQGNNGDMTLQSMIFEPTNRIIYLAAGSNAPTHPYQRIDLKEYFGAK
jgi:predicted choloylglycine hydrolase